MTRDVVLLRHLNGPNAGQETLLPHLPCRIGRAADDDLRLESPGVWEGHFQIERAKGDLLHLRSRDGALTSLNDRPVQWVALRQGDVIQAGGVRLQFWLSPVHQTGLQVRETLTWLVLGGLVAFQLSVALTLSP